jgi:hypothetical protein
VCVYVCVCVCVCVFCCADFCLSGVQPARPDQVDAKSSCEECAATRLLRSSQNLQGVRRHRLCTWALFYKHLFSYFSPFTANTFVNENEQQIVSDLAKPCN